MKASLGAFFRKPFRSTTLAYFDLNSPQVLRLSAVFGNLGPLFVTANQVRIHNGKPLTADRRHRHDLDAAVKVLQDLVVAPAAKRHSVRPDLTEPRPVAPPFSVEGVAIHSVRVLALVVDEEVVGN